MLQHLHRRLMVLLLFPLLLAPQTSQATLYPGDIAFIGMNTDGTTDKFAFVAVADIPGGEQIHFTDAGWKLPEKEFFPGESFVTWTAPTYGLDAGDIVELSLPNQLDPNGDQLFAFQGTFANPKFIAGLNNRGYGWQATATDLYTSALPRELQDGLTSISLSHMDNVEYDGPTSGDAYDFLIRLHDPSEWTGSNSYTRNFPSSLNIYNGTGYVLTNRVIEVDENAGTAELEFWSHTDGSHSVEINLQNTGTASKPQDFQFNDVRVYFSNDRYQTVTVTINDDAQCEGIETIQLELDPFCPQGTEFPVTQTSIRILDDEGSTFTRSQGFENSNTDNWAYTTSPGSYNYQTGPTPSEITDEVGVWSPVKRFADKYFAPQDEYFFGFQKFLYNSWHNITFQTIDLRDVEAATLQFKYFTFNNNSYNQRVQVSVKFDNSSSWSGFQSLPANSRYWRDTLIEIPASADYVRMRIRGLQLADVICAGIDDIQLTGSQCNFDISPSISSTNVCSNGGTLPVSFTATGNYASNNQFTAWLSGPTGSFANETLIGSIQLGGLDPGGTIQATIPNGTAPGTGYRIRVKSSAPNFVGIDNGVDLTISGIVLSASTTSPSCSAPNSGTAQASASGGTAPYTFIWTGPNNFQSNAQNLSGLGAGTYNLIVSDANGCANLTTLTITIDQANISLSSVDISCTGSNDGEINTVATGAAPFNYQWSGPSNFQSNAANPSGLSAGSYYVTLTDANGCIAMDSATIHEPQPLQVAGNVPLTGCGHAITCNGGQDGSIQLSVSGGTAPFNYLWQGPNGFTDTNRDINNLHPGSYAVTVTDSRLCQTTFNVTLTQPDPITAQIEAGAYNCGFGVSCHGASDGTAYLVGLGGGCPPYSYQWSNGDTTTTASNLAATTYQVTVTDAVGCQIVRSVTLNGPAPVTAQATPYPASCESASDGSVYLNPAGGCPPFQFTWTGPNGYTDTVQHPDSLLAGAYAYTLIDQNGCSYSGTVDVPFLNNIEATLGCCQDTFVCRGDSAFLDLTISGPGVLEVTYLQNGDTVHYLGAAGIHALGFQVNEVVQIELISVVSFGTGCGGSVCGTATIGVNDCGSGCDDLSVNVGFINRLTVGSCEEITLEIAADTLCDSLSNLCPGTRQLTFNADPYGNPIPAGTVVDSQWIDLGVTFSFVNNNSSKIATGLIFDSSNPTGGDDDLGTPNVAFGGPGIGNAGGPGNPGVNDVALGNLLILAENTIDANNDGLVDDPDDEAAGGEIQMNFASPLYVESLSIVDLDNGNGFIRVEQFGGTFTDYNIPGLGDNAVTTVAIQLDSVERVRVVLPSSGGISALAFCPAGPEFLDISIPCGTVSNFSNDAGLPMEVIYRDSASGITGIRVHGLPAPCGDTTGLSDFRLTYTVCDSGNGCGSYCLPMVAIGRNGCVQYDYAVSGSVLPAPESTPDKIPDEVGTPTNYLEIHPNPVQEHARVKVFLAEDDNALIQIFDLQGNRMQVVYGGVVAGEVEKSIEFTPVDLPDGMYILRVSTASGQQLHRKFMIMH